MLKLLASSAGEEEGNSQVLVQCVKIQGHRLSQEQLKLKKMLIDIVSPLHHPSPPPPPPPPPPPLTHGLHTSLSHP